MKITRKKLRLIIEAALHESWADTSWSMGDEKIMITDLIKHLPPMMYIGVLSLMSQLPNKLPTRGQERVDRARFGERNPDGTYTHFPIIIVVKDGAPMYVLDGNHRLQKAVDMINRGDLSRSIIKAQVLDVSDNNTKIPEIYKRLFG